MKKKFLFTLLALVCALGCTLGLSACGNKGGGAGDTSHSHEFWAGKCSICNLEYAPTEGLEYVEDGDAYMLISIGTATATDIIIPDRYNGKTVIIGESAFDGNTDIVSVTLPDNLTTNGTKWTVPLLAFSGCTSLKNVTIPVSVGTIDVKAFYGCKSLTKVNIYEGVEQIKNEAFSSCDSLTTISIPKSMKYFGAWIFAYSPKLKVINYGGTKEDWKAISKDPTWFSGSGNGFTVKCTDGDLSFAESKS